MPYFVKTPRWLKMIYSRYTWDMPGREKKIYFSFDDGPHPVATPFVLDQLKQYGALASFFCIGKNVQAYPEIYQRILDEGHAVGNHTQRHLNGWKTADNVYIEDVVEASGHIRTNLFRPPYGRIKTSQSREIRNNNKLGNLKIIMWDVISGDFDETIDGEKCYSNVIRNSGPGSIVVFHDSAKAFPRLNYCLPACLEFFSKKNYAFEKLA